MSVATSSDLRYPRSTTLVITQFLPPMFGRMQDEKIMIIFQNHESLFSVESDWADQENVPIVPVVLEYLLLPQNSSRIGPDDGSAIMRYGQPSMQGRNLNLHHEKSTSTSEGLSSCWPSRNSSVSIEALSATMYCRKGKMPVFACSPRPLSIGSCRFAVTLELPDSATSGRKIY
ncbi:hypothetical protein PM082_018945 [Marasmius tenuissimus]|nr:hypothetical protein PM082_018945 [Marasmius tenuissimus]